MLAGALCAALTGTTLARTSAEHDAEVCVAGTGSAGNDVNVCTRAILDAPLDPASIATLHVRRGEALVLQRLFDRAIADFDRAIELNPLSAAAFNGRGLARRGAGDDAAAIEDHTRAIVLFPRFARAWRNRATARIYAGDMRGALPDLDAALTLDGRDAEGIVLRGIVQVHLGDPLAAVADFDRALTLRFPYPYTSLWRYLAETALGRADAEARLTAEFARHAVQRWPRPLLDLFRGTGDEDEVLIAAGEAHPAFRERRIREARYYIGLHHLREGDTEAAAASFQAALEAGGDRIVEQATARIALDGIATRPGGIDVGG